MSTLTIFDLDDTLVNGDTPAIWRQYLEDNGFINDPSHAQKHREFVAQYAAGTLNIDDYLQFAIDPIAKIPATSVEEKLIDCMHHRVYPKVFDEAKALVRQLIETHGSDRVMIISATAEFIVKAVANELGIEHAIGVQIACEDGFYQPKIVGTPSFREGKVVRLKEWLKAHGQDQIEHITFYTDSINDLPLCEYADEVFTVNPCPQLKAIAEQRNWPILPWGQ